MKIVDICIIVTMAALLGVSVYVNFMLPKKIEKEKFKNPVKKTIK